MFIFTISLPGQDTVHLVELCGDSEPRQGRQQRWWKIDIAIVDSTAPDLRARVAGVGRKRDFVEEGRRAYAETLPRRVFGREGLQRKRAFSWKFGFVQQST